MSKTLLLISALFIIISSCTSENKNERTEEMISNSKEVIIDEKDEPLSPPEVPVNENWLVYEGVIGDYYQHVVLALTMREENTVAGTYYYDKHQKILDLNGTYNSESGVYELKESYKGKVTGYLTFKNVNGNLSGKWKAKKSSIEMQQLELNLLSKKTGSIPTVEFSKYKNEHTVFMYTPDGEEEMDVIDRLKIAKIDEDNSSFSYNVTGANGHMGSADGIIKMDNQTTGHFYGEDNCDLEFKFSKKGVEIIEHDCQYYHGARAYLDNELTLEK